MAKGLEALLTAAVQAPSGDNLQPWRFAVEEASGRIALYVDPSRDPSPMNAGQLMSRMALGAALENLLRTAEHNGWHVRLEEAEPPAVAALCLQEEPNDTPAVESAIRARVTNRRFYDGRPIAADVLARLREATPILHEVGTHWITERGRLAELAQLIGAADALMFREPSMRRAFRGNVRFDAAANTEVEFGLPVAALELSFFERMALRQMPWIPGWLLRLLSKPAFARRAERLVTSASGLCLGVAPDHRQSTYLPAGRAMQRAWLSLTTLGLAVQPMMSLVVLDHAFHHGGPELIDSLGRAELKRLGDDFRRLAPELAGGRPAFLLRFGYAPPPSGRTGRLPWQASQRQIPTPNPVRSL